MNTNMILNVEILAGSQIDDVVKEAIRKALKFNIGISFKFNGIDLVVFGGNNVNEIINRYKRDLKSEGDKK